MNDRSYSLRQQFAMVVLYIALLLVVSPASLIAQDSSVHTVQGIVTEGETDEPLPGVNVVVQGTTTGTTTDGSGEYELTVSSEDVVLEFSMVGFITQEEPVNGRSEINIAMAAGLDELGELVVVGYGEQRRATVTGSITDVQGSELARSSTVSLSNTFSGRLPGVTAMNRSGEPGADVSSLLIRGRSTLGNNAPLVVIDGVPGRQGLDQIDPRDVESVSVLKDASAAVYGAQAANGVILITTKRGSVMEPMISYNFEIGANQPTGLPEMADAASYAQLYNDILADRDEAPRFTDEEIQIMREGADPINYPDTDWIDETLKDYSTQTQHTLSVQGGSERARYYLSGNMRGQNSIFEGGITEFGTRGLRANIDVNVNESIEVSADLSVQQSDRIRPSVGTGTIMNSMWRNYPFLHARYENGLPGAGIERGENPVVMVTDEPGYREEQTNLYQTKIGAHLNIPQIEGLSLDGYFSADQQYGDDTRWRTPWTVYDYDSEIDEYNARVGGPVSQPDLRKTSENDVQLTANVQATYQQQFDRHFVESFVAAEYTRTSFEYFYAEREEFVSEALDQLFAGSTANQSTYGTSRQVNRSNLIGRLSYNFEERYLLDANFRYDGSSIFPAGNRWGFFPGLSVAWRVSEESFAQSDWLNDLRVRGSWGILGNDRVPPNQHLSTYSFTTGAFFGPNQTPNTGLVSGVSPNPNITWEEARSINLGIDAELWDGALGLTFEVFETKRSNILTSRNASIPAYTALRLPDENIGIVENRGMEFELSHRQARQNFHFMAGANLGYSRNEIKFIDEPTGIPDHQRQEGKPIGSRLLYISDGIFTSQDELDNRPSIPNAQLGDPILRDVNGDGVIDSRDQVLIDRSPTPEVTFGINVGMGYGDFDVTMLWQGATRASQYFQLQTGLGGNTLQEIADHRYTEDNPNPRYPNVVGQGWGTYASDIWYMDASFLRLKDVMIRYTVPEMLSSAVRLENMSVYLSGRNLLTFAENDWFDPEGLGSTEHRRNFYPPNRTISLGINLGI